MSSGTDTESHMRILSAAGKVVAVVAPLLGGTWLLLEQTIGPMRENAAKTQSYIDELRTVDRQMTASAHAVEVNLRDTLTALTAELRVTNGQLAGLAASLTALDRSVQNVSSELRQAEDRQQQFERWVVLRLGVADPASPAGLPLGWEKQQIDILKSLNSGDDPLAIWYKSSTLLEQ